MSLRPLVAWQLGHARALGGDPTAGVALLEDSLASIKATGMGVFGAPATVHLGEGYLAAGRLREALDTAEDAVAAARARGQRGVEAWAVRLRAEASASALATERAAPDYEQALKLAEDLQMRPLVAHCHVGLAGLAARRRQDREAREHLDLGRGMYRALGMRPTPVPPIAGDSRRS